MSAEALPPPAVDFSCPNLPRCERIVNLRRAGSQAQLYASPLLMGESAAILLSTSQEAARLEEQVPPREQTCATCPRFPLATGES